MQPAHMFAEATFPCWKPLGKTLPRTPDQDPHAPPYHFESIKTQQSGAGQKAKSLGSSERQAGRE